MALDKQIKKQSNFFYTNLFAISAICFLGIVIYSNTFLNTFHFDDKRYITDNFAIRNIENLKAIWDCFPSRFVTFFTFALNYRFNALEVFGYHVFNLIIHLGSAILVWWLTNLIFSAPTLQKDKILPFSSLISLFTALIFVSHPIQTETVTYIWQRCSSLAAAFYLFSLCLYVKSRLWQINGRYIAKRKVFYMLSMAFAVISMFTKENSATLPLMIILCEFYFLKPSKNIRWKYVVPFLFLLPLIPAVLFLSRPDTFDDLDQLFHRPINAGWYYFLTQLRVMVTYVRLIFVPINQNLDYDYPVMKTIFQPEVILSLILLSVILFAAFKFSRKYKVLSFSILWFFITLLPESSFIPLRDAIFEHRLYLPMAGFSIFLVSGLYYLFQPKRLSSMVIILSLPIVIYSLMTYQRNKIWKDEITLWTDAVHKSPNKGRPYNNQGVVYQDKGEFERAIDNYNKAIEKEPYYTDAYNNLGLAYRTKGQLDQAIYYFTKVVEIDPSYAQAYNNRGVTYHNKGKSDEALSDYNKATELNPKLAEAYNNAGLIYLARNELDQALHYFNKAIEIDPSYAKAYNSRGVVHHNKGEFEKALSDYNKALKIDPKTVGAYNNRESLYREMK